MPRHLTLVPPLRERPQTAPREPRLTPASSIDVARPVSNVRLVPQLDPAIETLNS
jgi:hypothetical protein